MPVVTQMDMGTVRQSRRQITEPSDGGVSD